MSRTDKSKNIIIVAIDGPAGSGKSTVAKMTARKLGYSYIDTGAMYRALTMKAIHEDVAADDAEGLIALAANTVIEQEPDETGTGARTFVDGEDVSAMIRTPDVTAAVSAVSSHPDVRKLLVERQRYLVSEAREGAVVEGRDVGTVVFPNADVKIYMDASVSERAKRRLKDMRDAGVRVPLVELENLIKTRDATDSNREASPLFKAADATVIDTTGMTVDEAVEAVAALVQTRKG